MNISFYWWRYERGCQWRTGLALSSHIWSRRNLSVCRPSDCSAHKCPMQWLSQFISTRFCHLCACKCLIFCTSKQSEEFNDLKRLSCSSPLVTGLLPQKASGRWNRELVNANNVGPWAERVPAYATEFHQCQGLHCSYTVYLRFY